MPIHSSVVGQTIKAESSSTWVWKTSVEDSMALGLLIVI